MDPLGQFVDAFGKNTSAPEVADKVKEAMQKWEKAGGMVAASAALAAATATGAQ
jgi:protein SCO1/2